MPAPITGVRLVTGAARNADAIVTVPRRWWKSRLLRIFLVSLSTYLGSMGRGYLAALASTFPVITGMTFVLIYLTGGSANTLAYAKNLLLFVPPWVSYVSFVILSVSRIGFWPAIVLAATPGTWSTAIP